MKNELATTLITGNIGTVVLVLILWRAGVLKFLLNGKKENGELQNLTNTMNKLEQHFNSDTTVLLTEINQQLREHGQKLDKISDVVIYLKAKVKNGSQ